MITSNLPSGYHRDLQLLKEHIFPAFQDLRNCLSMAALMIENMEVKKNLLEDEKYQYLFSVEEVNKLVLAGMPFRDAYKKVGLDIESGNFTYNTNIQHTHEGSIGNLNNKEIANMMKDAVAKFNLDLIENKIKSLLQ
jgi:argininosuccinate lyase